MATNIFYGIKQGPVYEQMVVDAKVDKVTVTAIQGVWSEPAAPPPVTATLALDQPQVAVAALLLRANRPSTVKLQGPADLLFRSFAIRLTARSLVRNLARPEWGSTRSITGESTPKTELLLPGPCRIEAVGIRVEKGSKAVQPAAVQVQHKEAGQLKTWVASLGFHTLAGKAKNKTAYSGFHEQAVVTDSVLFHTTDGSADLLLRSPSLPSRVAIGVGDDTPAQLFPTELEAGSTFTTRDLTAQINGAWRRAAAGTTTVELRITSLTDGVVQVDLDGAWGRSFVAPEAPVALDGSNPVTLAVPWPFGPTVPDASIGLKLTGRVEGGRRLRLAPGSHAFGVRVGEQLEVAQAFRLVQATQPQAVRDLQAVWLLLPQLPRREQRVEIRLAAAEGEPPAPADQPLARVEVTLPVDAAAYTAQGGGFWFRAPFDQPVPLDGLQVTQPLFLVAAGREDGTLLAHAGLSGPVTAAARLPAAAGVGASLVRNRDQTGAWAVQAFNRSPARWLIDLELSPLPAEYGGLVTATYPGSPPRPVPITGPARAVVEVAPATVQRPPSGTLAVQLNAPVRAGFTAQVQLYRSVRP